jgi:glycerate-2-kinase
VSARFPGEPFSPDRLPDPNAAPRGTDTLFSTIYRAAVTGGDAYRAARTGLRREGPVLRLGNRFVALDRYREVAFVALGTASVSLALAATAALGERLTQGFVVGPDPLPAEVPFRSRVEPTGWPGRSSVAEEVLELARGLTARDLLILLLSPGALGYLATAPANRSPTDWSRELRELSEGGASSREVALVARTFGEGAVGGRVAASTTADLVCLGVDRGDGAGLLGGGPTRPVMADESEQAREILHRLGRPEADALPAVPLSRRALASGAPRSIRPVAVATPADALREVDAAVREKRWRTALADVTLDLAPEAAADRLLAKAEEVLQHEELGTPVDGKASRGLLILAGATLSVPEGVEDRDAIRRFLTRAAASLPRRDATVGILRTAGGPSAGAPGGGVVGAGPKEARSGPTNVRPLPMRSGITDVGLIAAMVVPVA